MVEDSDQRKVERILFHLSQVEKTYKVDKRKGARDLLMQQALKGGTEELEAVCRFKEDPTILSVFKGEATRLFQGDISRSRYNVCLGLLGGRLMLW